MSRSRQNYGSFSFKNPQKNIIISEDNQTAQLSPEFVRDEVGEGVVCVSNLFVESGKSIEFTIDLKDAFFFDPPPSEFVEQGYPKGKFHLADQLMVGLLANADKWIGEDTSRLLEIENERNLLMLDQVYNGPEYLICGMRYTDDELYMSKYRENGKKIAKIVPDLENSGDKRHYRINLVNPESSFFDIACNDSGSIRVHFPSDSVKKRVKYSVILCLVAPDKVSLIPLDHQPSRENSQKVRQFKNCSGCGKRKKDLKVCSNCKQEYYCSRECQIQCWKSYHKSECKKLKKLYVQEQQESSKNEL